MAAIVIGMDNFGNYGTHIILSDSLITNTGKATGAGICDTAKVNVRANATGVYVGTVYNTSTNKFKTRDYANIGNMSSGVQTVTGLSIDCEVDDFASLYASSGTLNLHDLAGWKHDTSNVFTSGELTFTAVATWAGYSFTLTGETVAVGGGALVGGSALVGGQILCGNGPLIN
jgi:hypothetical protein